MTNHNRVRRLIRFLARIMATLAVVVLIGPVALVQADSAPPAQGVSIRDVGFDPHLDAQVPLDLTFRDETGQAVRLQDYFAGKPVILTLNYYKCENLCPLILRNLADTLVQVPYKLGDEYAAVTVSIDPTETPADATATRTEVMHRYARPDTPHAAQGWHFLTGDEASIKQLAQTVGFRYAYNAAEKTFAHPAGAILLTPGGHVSRYLYGMDFAPNDVRLALAESSQNKISSPVTAVLLLCYHYDPSTGRYSNVALGAVRAGGVLTLLGLGSFLAVMWRRDLKHTPPAGSSPTDQRG